MPQLVTLRIAHDEGRPIRIWLPVVPIVLVLSPILVLAVPAGAVASVILRVNLVWALVGGWRVFCASSGTRVQVEQGGSTAVLVSIR